MRAAADTIAAIATAAGAGGVGVIRISGPRAEDILRRVVPALGQVDSHRLTLAKARSADGEVLDEVLAVVMRAPRSYTGEDVAELHAHGGTLNLRRLLEAVVAAGARVAEPGEFTRRAFEAGRIDLARAEAVADVVAAESERALRIAQAQLGGSVGERVREFRGELIALLAEVEGSIDFPGEGLEEISRAELSRRAHAVAGEAAGLAATYRHGRVLAEGLEVALVGAPNAGKSSLLNRLAGRARAVVSAEPGTTRDFVEARVVWSGVPVTLIDTPGQRTGAGDIESQALVIARARAAEADVRVIVLDSLESRTAPDVESKVESSKSKVPETFSTFDLRLSTFDLTASGGQRVVVALNKADLISVDAMNARVAGLVDRGVDAVSVSALTGGGIDALIAALLGGTRESVGGEDAPVVTSARQHALLEATAAAARAAAQAVDREAPAELVASDLRAALRTSGELLGEGTAEEVIDAVFARFCIGK